MLWLESVCLVRGGWQHHCLSVGPEAPARLPAAAAAKLLQSCPTLCDPVDSSPPGSCVHGILQARVLEWVAIAFSKRSLLQVF